MYASSLMSFEAVWSWGFIRQGAILKRDFMIENVNKITVRQVLMAADYVRRITA